MADVYQPAVPMFGSFVSICVKEDESNHVPLDHNDHAHIHHDREFEFAKKIVQRVGEVKCDNRFRATAQAKWIVLIQLPVFFHESSNRSAAHDRTHDRVFFLVSHDGSWSGRA
jgi:hypothetical protein